MLLESPGYPASPTPRAAHRLRIAPIGVSIDGLGPLGRTAGARRAPRRPGARHAPTTRTRPATTPPTAERRELLDALPPTTFVIADETFRDLTLDPSARPARPMGCHGSSDRVITLGSLSKSVWAGLRVGWIRASHDLVRRIATSRTSQDSSTPVVDQLVAVAGAASMYDTLIATGTPRCASAVPG